MPEGDSTMVSGPPSVPSKLCVRQMLRSARPVRPADIYQPQIVFFSTRRTQKGTLGSPCSPFVPAGMGCGIAKYHSRERRNEGPHSLPGRIDGGHSWRHDRGCLPGEILGCS